MEINGIFARPRATPPISLSSFFCLHVLLSFSFYPVLLLFLPSPLGSPGLPLERDSRHKTSLIISPTPGSISRTPGESGRAAGPGSFQDDKRFTRATRPWGVWEGSCQEALLTCSAVVWLCCGSARRMQTYSSDVMERGAAAPLRMICASFAHKHHVWLASTLGFLIAVFAQELRFYKWKCKY